MAAAPIVLGITIRADGSSQVQGELNNIRTGLNNAGTAANQTNREFADMARETLGLGNALKGLAAGLSVMAMYQSAKDIIMLADKMTLLDSRIKIATKSIDDYRAASAALTQISLATGASLESNVVMFGRLNKSVEASGGTYKTTLGLVETLNEGLKISGASAGEASSVMIQLSQALSSGVLRGDEFNSIMENGSRIVEALTTATGKTRGELRALAADGKLTSEIVIGAMQQQADAIHKDFSAIPLTIGAALENINTSFSRYIENLNKSSGATSSFAQSLNGISKNLDPIISGIVTLGEVAATVFAGQLVASMGSYVTAKYAAIAMERAHTAALAINAEMSAAATAAQVANTRAMLAGDVSMGTRMALTNQLNILIAEQTAVTSAAAIATAELGLSFKALLSPINLVNIGLAGLVGWEIGGFLNKFESVRRVANDVLYSVATALEFVSYQWDKFNAKAGDKAGIEAAHSAQTAMISDLISETNSYAKAGENAVTATTSQGEALKAFSVNIDETTKKHKAQKEALTEEQKAANSLQAAYASLAASQAKEIALAGNSSKSAGVEYEVTNGALKGLTETKKLYLLQQAQEIQHNEITKKETEARKTELDALKDKYSQLTLSARDYYQAQLADKGISDAAITPMMAQFDKNAGAEASKKAITDTKAELDAYNKSLDSASSKTSDLSSVTKAVFDGALGGISAMAGAFDTMITSIDKSTEALVKNAAMQKLNNSSSDSAEKSANTAKYAKEELKLNSQILNDKLTGTRQIAGAVSSMLKQGSTEQKAAHAIEMGIAGWQMAQNLITLFGIGAVSTAETASVIPSVAASTIKGAAKAAEAVATQATAGPYIGFVMMAAMAAAMAAIGFGVGGGSASAPYQPPTSPETGTVLGDPSAKSESLAKTNQLLQDAQSKNYPVLLNIANGIGNISNGIINAATRIFQSGSTAIDPAINTQIALSSTSKLIEKIAFGYQALMTPLTTGLLLLVKYIPFVGGFVTSIIDGVVGGLFGRTEKSVQGGGVNIPSASLSSLNKDANVNASGYATIETKTSGWFFVNKSYRDIATELSKSASDALNTVFISMGKTMYSMADALGADAKAKVEAYIIPALHIELRGLSSDDASKRMNAVISTTLDNMALAVFGDTVGIYQKLGEGMFDTAVRIITEVAAVKDALGVAGMTLTNDAIAISDALIQAAGGITEFQKAFANYFDKFSSDAEKQTRLQSQIQANLDGVKLSLASSRDGYRKQLEAVDASTEAGRAQYTMLIKLTASADQYYSTIEAGTKNQRGLDIDLLTAQGNVGEAVAAKRADEIDAMRLDYGEVAANTLLLINSAIDVDAATAALAANIGKINAIINKTPVQAQAATGSTLYAALKDLIPAATLSAIAKSREAFAAYFKTVTDPKIITALGANSTAIAAWLDNLEAAASKAAEISRAAISAAMTVLQASVTAERKVITDTYTLTVTAQQKSIDGLTTSVGKLSSIANTLKSTLNSLSLVAPKSEAINRAQAQATIASALILAKTGGVGAIDEAALNSALSTVAKPSESLFSTFTEYQKDFLQTSINISELSGLAGDQLSTGNEQLDAAKDQLKATHDLQNAAMSRLDKLIIGAQAQVDAANNTTIAVMSIADALAGLTKATGGTLVMPMSAPKPGAPPPALSPYYEGATSTGYESAGGATYSSAMRNISGIDGSTTSIDDAISFVKTSDPMPAYLAAKKAGVSAASLDAMMGWASGTSNAWALSKNLPKFAAGGDHAGGWRMVGENGPELENTGPSRIHSNSQSKALIDNTELIAEIKALREEVKAGQSAIAANTRKSAKILHDVTQNGTSISTSVAA